MKYPRGGGEAEQRACRVIARASGPWTASRWSPGEKHPFTNKQSQMSAIRGQETAARKPHSKKSQAHTTNETGYQTTEPNQIGDRYV